MYFLIWVALLLIGINAAHHRRELPSRIVGGKDAVIKDYPYQVSIQLYDYHWCGGSIISRNYVLTAAHCVTYAYGGEFTVRAGSALHDEGGSLHRVEWNLTYPEQRSDAALLRVAEPFIYDATRQPVKLFEAAESVTPGTLSNVTGWGRTRENAPDISRKLQVVSVPLISHETCAKIFNNTEVGPFVVGQLCAGYLGQGVKDACQGDSGGPLVIDGKQIGVVSTGIGCARPEYPGIYASVEFVRPWIKKHSGV